MFLLHAEKIFESIFLIFFLFTWYNFLNRLIKMISGIKCNFGKRKMMTDNNKLIGTKTERLPQGKINDIAAVGRRIRDLCGIHQQRLSGASQSSVKISSGCALPLVLRPMS